MKIDTLRRHFREAYRGIVKNSWMSFAAIGAVAVTLMIFGVFVIFAINLGSITDEVGDNVSMNVVLKDEVTKEQAAALTTKIKGLPNVNDARFISKDEGVDEVKKNLKDADFTRVLQKGENNFLPNLIKVTPKNVSVSKQVEQSVKDLEGIENVKNSNTAKELLDSVLLFKNIILVFGVGLAVLAAFLISNTIKLTIIARRREIEVQRLVGASNWFIRWPFFIEGGFIGFVGSVLPIGVLLLVYQGFVKMISGGSQNTNLLQMVGFGDMAMYLTVSILGIGIFIGVFGSILSIRRFLKI
ncbi:cell division transport system permease protein [Thermoactinomyces sp. DSM 45891]|uniref:permease-like cell division protein FtsX n=1 Tax=Thermoactinomyces sp. DSM 45891 TaxID=1761907 RepID=UPI00091AD96A|nr:permease-like cell division protein FtsX [Thermoactinomyces sp. DSM 45891]SFX22729.1 cell division transport system permease protein [Thermoactinomyces sp. DSM 45891]